MTAGGLENAGWLALIAIVPLIVLMLTSFVKVSVVLSLLRNAIGATDAPSGLVVMGVSLILTLFVMAPVAVEMMQASAAPAYQGGTRSPAPGPGPVPGSGSAAGSVAGPAASPNPAAAPTADTSADPPTTRPSPPLDLEASVRQLVPPAMHGQLDTLVRSLAPLRGFLTRNTAARDRETFVALSQRMGHAPRGDELWVLAPAFLTTELKEAFAIAVLIFLPFLVIDLVVGLGLAALGLSSTSPQVVALPLKLLLFVAVDGWRLLIDSLLRGYA